MLPDSSFQKSFSSSTLFTSAVILKRSIQNRFVSAPVTAPVGHGLQTPCWLSLLKSSRLFKICVMTFGSFWLATYNELIGVIDPWWHGGKIQANQPSPQEQNCGYPQEWFLSRNNLTTELYANIKILGPHGYKWTPRDEHWKSSTEPQDNNIGPGEELGGLGHKAKPWPTGIVTWYKRIHIHHSLKDCHIRKKLLL